MITLQHFLVLSALLLCLGVYVALTRKNAVAILMGIELILNAAGIAFVAFSRYAIGAVDGQVFVIFIIIVAVCETAVALAIILNIYQNFRTVDTDRTQELKG